MSEERVLSWNCKGARSKEFACELQSIIREFRPTVVVLIEPRISGKSAEEVCGGLRKNKWVRSKATSFSGGVWVLWEEGDVYLKLEFHDKLFLHFLVSAGDGSEWALMAVYMHAISSIR